MPLATVDQLEDIIGQLRLAQMISIPEDRRPQRYLDMLSAAAGYIYEAAAQGGFVTPFDLTQIPAGELRDSTAAMLAAHCCCLAIWSALPQVVDAPEGLKKAKAEADAFLATIAKGTAILGGLARVAPPGAAGRVGFAGSGQGTAVLSSAFFERWRHAWPIGPGADLDINLRGGDF